MLLLQAMQGSLYGSYRPSRILRKLDSSYHRHRHEERVIFTVKYKFLIFCNRLYLKEPFLLHIMISRYSAPVAIKV
jgi:hypothetical protein